MVSLYESPIENTISHFTPHYTYDSLCKIRDCILIFFDNIVGVHLILEMI